MTAPRVLAILPAFIPSTLISIVKPLVRLHHRGMVRARIALEHFTFPADVAWAEVAVFCRNCEPRFARHREALLARGTPYVYDLDDNLFEIPLDTLEGRHQREPARLRELTSYLEQASLVRVYSGELLARASALNAAAVQVQPSLDWSLVPDELPPRNPHRVRVVYVTSRIEDDLARLLVADLRILLARHGDRVEVTFWGGGRAHREVPGALSLAPVPDYDRFLSRLARSGFDVGLAPLRDDVFHRSKTNNKYREYGACGIAGAYSDVSVYSSCVVDGVTGLLVPQRPGAWQEAVSRLVREEPLRETIRHAARRDVRARYSQERAEAVWLEQIEGLREMRMRQPPRPRPGAVVAAPGPGLELSARLARVAGRIRRYGMRTTLVGAWWYAHGLRTMLRLRRELSRD